MLGWSVRWCIFFFFKQKTAYEMRISDWSSDVCSSDLDENHPLSGKAAWTGARTEDPRERRRQRRQAAASNPVAGGRERERAAPLRSAAAAMRAIPARQPRRARSREVSIRTATPKNREECTQARTAERQIGERGVATGRIR